MCGGARADNRSTVQHSTGNITLRDVAELRPFAGRLVADRARPPWRWPSPRWTAHYAFARRDFSVVMIATAATMIAEATSVRVVMGSASRSQPRKTATIGFT